MKKLIGSFIFLIFAACGTQKKAIVDPFVGVYDMTVFEVTQIGDIPLKLIIKKDNGGYVSEIETNSQDPAASEYFLGLSTASLDAHNHEKCFPAGAATHASAPKFLATHQRQRRT